MPNQESCKNCDASFDSSYDYCPHCGQETADNLTFGILFSNTISNYFSIDARFFKSFIPLMTRPGVLARRFVDGKRLSYLHPAQFYLFISVIFFFLFSFNVRQADNAVTNALKKGFEKDMVLDSLEIKKDSIGLEIAKKALKKNQKYTGLNDEDLEAIDSVISAEQESPDLSFSFKRSVLDSLIENNAPIQEQLEAMGMDKDENGFTRKFYEKVLKFYNQRGVGRLKTLYDTIPIAMFLMLPLFAVLLKLFYWRRGTFAHHMVFSFYFFTFLFTSFCVLILTNKLIDLPLWVEIVVFLSFVVYLLLALRNFYKSSWIGAIVKSYTISFLYLLIILPIAFMGIVMVSFMLY
jgi:hypothetical protein